MAILTPEQARDAVNARIRAVWEAEKGVSIPSDAPLFYDNDEGKRPTSDQRPKFFGRVTVRFADSPRNTLGPNGTFRTTGTLFVQLFQRTGSGLDTIDAMSEAILSDLRSTERIDTMRLRDIGSSELGPDDTYFQTNVRANFDFDIPK